MKLRFDHAGIVVRNLEESIRFYSEVFGFRQPKTGPYSKTLIVDEPGYKLRYALLEADGFFIEFLEPKEGPWVKRLEEKGEGSICEICVVVDNVEEFYDRMKNRGITPVDRFGKPLVGKKYVEAPSGAKFMYLAPTETHGTMIEVLERSWKPEFRS